MGRSWIIGGAVALAGVAVVVCAAAPAMATPFPWPDGLGPRGGGGPEGQQLLVHHPPTQAGGATADTSFINMLGNPSWQLAADDFTPVAPAIAMRISWYGFYFQDNPPAAETMRVRFYDARPADGLPGDVLYEESFLNPSRVATGLVVGGLNLPDEYIYEVNLTMPMALAAGTRYWLEIVQVGDQSTAFGFEFGLFDQNGRAFVNPNVPDWTLTAPGTSDLAFQIWGVPEPNVLLLLLIGVPFSFKRRQLRSATEKRSLSIFRSLGEIGDPSCSPKRARSWHSLYCTSSATRTVRPHS